MKVYSRTPGLDRLDSRERRGYAKNVAGGKTLRLLRIAVAGTALAATLGVSACTAETERLAGAKGAPVAIGGAVPDLQLFDEKGKQRSLFEGVGKGDVLVLGFYSHRCPYNVAFWDEIASLAKDFGGKGVKFLGVNPNRKETLKDVRKGAAEGGVTHPIFRDQGLAVTDRLGALATPHMMVVDSKRVLRYRGAVDDGRGKNEQAENHHLRLALDSVLAGKAVPEPQPASFIGCTIKR